MRTKKAKGPGRRSSLDDSAGEDSDVVGSDIDRLPDDSSSDDDLGPSAAQHASLAGGSAGLLGRGHAALPYALVGDARAMQHPQAHRGMPVGSAAWRAQPQGGRPHGPVRAAQLPGGAVNGGAPAAGASGAKATAVSNLPRPSAGSRRSAGDKATRHAAVKEDPTVRRIKAQVFYKLCSGYV
jgi:hypothetical protein